MYKGVALDFDGVIAQTEELHRKTFEEVLKDYDAKFSIDRWYTDFAGTGSYNIMKRLFDEYGINGSVEEFVNRRRDIFLGHTERGELKPTSGLNNFLRKMKDKKIKLAVASGGHHNYIELFLEKLGIRDFFCTIVSGDVVDNKKPHPETFLTAAERMKVEAVDCVAVEDSPNGLMSAAGAGMYVVCMDSPARKNLKGCGTLIHNFNDFPYHIVGIE